MKKIIHIQTPEDARKKAVALREARFKARELSREKLWEKKDGKNQSLERFR